MLDRNFDRASFGYWNKNAVIPFYLLSQQNTYILLHTNTKERLSYTSVGNIKIQERIVQTVPNSIKKLCKSKTKNK